MRRVLAFLMLTLALPAIAPAQAPYIDSEAAKYAREVLLPRLNRDLAPSSWHSFHESYILENYLDETDAYHDRYIWSDLVKADIATSWEMPGFRTYHLRKINFSAAKNYLEELIANYTRDKNNEQLLIKAEVTAAAAKVTEETKVKSVKLSEQKNRLIGNWYLVGSENQIQYILFIKIVFGYLNVSICTPDTHFFPSAEKACAGKNIVKIETFYDNPSLEKFCLNGDASCSVKIEEGNQKDVIDYYFHDSSSPGPVGHLNPLTPQALASPIKKKSVPDFDLKRQLKAFPSQWQSIQGTNALLRIWQQSAKKDVIQVQVCSTETSTEANTACIPFSEEYKKILTFSYHPDYKSFIDIGGSNGVRITEDGQLVFFVVSSVLPGASDDELKIKTNSSVYSMLDRRAITERLLLQKHFEEDKARQLKALVGDWYSHGYGNDWTEDFRKIWVDKSNPKRFLIATCDVAKYRASKGKNCQLMENETTRVLLYNADFRGFCIGNHTNCEPGIRLPRNETDRFIYIEDPSKQLNVKDGDLQGYSFNRITPSFIY